VANSVDFMLLAEKNAVQGMPWQRQSSWLLETAQIAKEEARAKVEV